MKNETSETGDDSETRNQSPYTKVASRKNKDSFAEYRDEQGNVKDEENEFLWQAELDRDSDLEVVSMTEQDYFSICNEFRNALKRLLTDELTNEYAIFTMLFKKFRTTFLYSQKLAGKVFELESVKRFLEGKKDELLQKLDERDEQERELRVSYMTIRNAIAETVKEKNVVEKQRDEMKEKLSQIPDELFKVIYNINMLFTFVCFMFDFLFGRYNVTNFVINFSQLLLLHLKSSIHLCSVIEAFNECLRMSEKYFVLTNEHKYCNQYRGKGLYLEPVLETWEKRNPIR